MIFITKIKYRELFIIYYKYDSDNLFALTLLVPGIAIGNFNRF